MKFLSKYLLSSLSVMIAAYLLPGVELKSYFVAMIVVAVMALCNVILKPILILLTLPITILTLGLFLLVINVLMIFIVSALVPGFVVNGFFNAILFGLIIAIFNWFFHGMVDDEDN